MKTSSAIFLASATSTLATLDQSDPYSGAFSVAAIYSGQKRELQHELYRIWNKYVPAETRAAILAAAKHTRSTGSVVTRPEPNAGKTDVRYLTEIFVGTPAQKLRVDFDTGSSDLWVFSNDTNPALVNNQTLYYPGKSNTASRITNQTWQVAYADKSQSAGIVYSDTVTIGGLTVKGQAVESAQTVSAQFFNDSQSSGLLGLALTKGNLVKPDQQNTWFDNVKPQLDAPLFTVRLRHQAPGYYNFGYIDKSQYTGEIYYTPAFSDQDGRRLFNSTGYAIGSKPTKKVAITATADTGTSTVIVPDDVAREYWSNVPSIPINSDFGTSWYYLCSADLPTFSFNVGEGEVVLPSADLQYAAFDGALCEGAIATINGTEDLYIFGDAALKSSFVVFDDGNNRIGWAKGS